MAYTYYDPETGEAGIGGEPSEQEEEADTDGAEALSPDEVKDL